MIECVDRGHVSSSNGRRFQDCRATEAAGALGLHDIVAVPILDIKRG